VYLTVDRHKVRGLRTERGLSQQELAGRAGVYKRTLQDIESPSSSRRQMPETVNKIAAALDVDPRSLATVASERGLRWQKG